MAVCSTYYSEKPYGGPSQAEFGRQDPRAKIRLIAVLGGRRRAFGRLGRLNDPRGHLGWEDAGRRRRSLLGFGGDCGD